MKKTSQRFLSIAAASVLIIGATTGAFARGGLGPGGQHGPCHGPPWTMSDDPLAYADQRLSQLKTNLAITPEQEGAWNAYAEAVRDKAALRASHRQAMLGSGAITAEQRLSFHQEGLAQRQKLAAARRDLYAALTPAQQASAGRQLGPHRGPRWAR